MEDRARDYKRSGEYFAVAQRNRNILPASSEQMCHDLSRKLEAAENLNFGISKMKKFFNTTGPCNAADHYMLDPVAWAGDFETMLEQKAYFVIHAPRQSGKTTLLEVLSKKLTKEGKYCALRMSCEIGQPFGGDFDGAELALLELLRQVAETELPSELLPFCFTFDAAAP